MDIDVHRPRPNAHPAFTEVGETRQRGHHMHVRHFRSNNGSPGDHRPPRRGRRPLVALAAVAAMLGGLLATAVAPAGADQVGVMPVFHSSNGITVVSQVNSGREIDLTVRTSAVSGTHEIIVLLPTTYTQNTTTRYPSMYLLNGAMAGPSQWVADGGAAETISRGYQTIMVMPDGGPKGWYVNWSSCATICPQNWETFHNAQVVPFIDGNLRTIANRSGRTVSGLSMGGFGAVHYAEAYPNLYGTVASFSGAVDTGNATTLSAVFGEETGLVPNSGTPVPGGSIFGNIWPFASQKSLDVAGVNMNNIVKLANTRVLLYVGTGSGGDVVESSVKPQNDLMANRLWQKGVNYWYSQDHTTSPALGWGCNDGHTIMCWNAYLNDAMAKVFGPSTPPPVNPPSGNAVTDAGFETAGLGPWQCIGNCGVDSGAGNAHSGAGNGWVRNNNNGNWNDIHQTLSVAPNTNYTLTGWVRTSANNTAGYFGVRTTSGQVIGEQQFGNVGGYSLLTVHLNSGNNTQVQVYGGLWPNGDTWLQLDDVSLVAG